MTLAALRADPAGCCLQNVYRNGPAGGSFQTTGGFAEGGRCTIGFSQAKDIVFDLKATASSTGTDYFFPWLQRGVGWVKVPKTATNGTIVMTGGVNGCTIVVTETATDYYFYHDGDSKYLKAEMCTGREVARVVPNDYDPRGMGQKMFQAALEEASRKGIRPTGDVSYGHFVFAVKKDGRFGLYSTGVMSVNGFKKLPMGLAPCITSFG